MDGVGRDLSIDCGFIFPSPHRLSKQAERLAPGLLLPTAWPSPRFHVPPRIPIAIGLSLAVAANGFGMGFPPVRLAAGILVAGGRSLGRLVPTLVVTGGSLRNAVPTLVVTGGNLPYPATTLGVRSGSLPWPATTLGGIRESLPRVATTVGMI